jgi:hypothetical protein
MFTIPLSCGRPPAASWKNPSQMKYFVAVVVFGIIPIWVLWLWLVLKNDPFSSWDLVADGALFPFACTTAITSFLTHMRIFSRVERDEIFWAFSIVALIIIVSIVGYLTGVEHTPKSFEIKMNPNQDIFAIAVATAALIYGFVVETRIKRVLP